MSQIEAINWQGKKVPPQHDRPDKTIFLVEEFSPKFANLVMYPLEADTVEHGARLSAYIKTDAAALKAKLSGRGFMFLMRADDSAIVAQCAASLIGLGYRARMLRDNMFFRVPVPRRVVGAEFTGAGVDFNTAGTGHVVSFPAGEPVFCVFADPRPVKRLVELKKIDKNPPPAPKGDVSFRPMFERGIPYVCDIYAPYKWTAVRIESEKFSFSCLGGEALPNSSLNMGILLDKLAAMPLNMIWDDRFPESSVIGMKTQMEMAASSNSLASASMSGKPEEAQFNFYSRFRYMLELAGGLKCFS